tara:strand:+ start:1162 stop:1941 length:780 start_codon:yes stop_codon:yes gene_type:complete
MKKSELKKIIKEQLRGIKPQKGNQTQSSTALTCVSNMQAIEGGAQGQLEGYLIPAPPQSNVTNAVNKMKVLYGSQYFYIYGTTSSGFEVAVKMYSQYGCTELADPSFYAKPPFSDTFGNTNISPIGFSPIGENKENKMKKSQLRKLIRETIKEQLGSAGPRPTRPGNKKPNVSHAQIANEIGCKPGVSCLGAYTQYFNATNGGDGHLPTPQEVQQKYPDINRPQGEPRLWGFLIWIVIVGGAWWGSKKWRDSQGGGDDE